MLSGYMFVCNFYFQENKQVNLRFPRRNVPGKSRTLTGSVSTISLSSRSFRRLRYSRRNCTAFRESTLLAWPMTVVSRKCTRTFQAIRVNGVKARPIRVDAENCIRVYARCHSCVTFALKITSNRTTRRRASSECSFR